MDSEFVEIGPLKLSSAAERDEEPAEVTVDDLAALPVAAVVLRSRQRGSVGRDELDPALQPGESRADRIGYAMTVLTEAGIAVTESEVTEEDGGDQPPPSVEAAINEDEPGSTDDATTIHLRETRRDVQLISEGEVTLAKRIEAGRRAVLAALCESLLATQAVATWRDGPDGFAEAAQCDRRGGDP